MKRVFEIEFILGGNVDWEVYKSVSNEGALRQFKNAHTNDFSQIKIIRIKDCGQVHTF